VKQNFEDRFSDAEAYESYVGRWSRLVAQEFIAWLDAAPGQAWLDVGAGTGVLTVAILQIASPSRVLAVDLSPEYIEFARQRMRDDRVEFRVGDAVSIAFESPEFDLSVAGLVLNFLPAPQQAVQHMAQAVGSGGTVAAYVWDYSGQMEMMRHFWDAASKVDPSAHEMDAGQRFTLCKPDNLRSLFQAVGLTAVEVIPIDIQTRFTDFDDYWTPFLAAQGSVSRYLRGLSEDTRTALRDQLQRQLPTSDDGAIPLVARAWAVKGKKDTSV
jgi:ubiquinone/menaquinone biosynthesis C-methylase UbiE